MTRVPFIAPLLLTLLGLLATTTACNDDSCYDNGSSLPLASFYVGSQHQEIAGLTIVGIGAPGDSLLADSATLNEAYLPLRASASTTSYALSRWVTIGSSRVYLRDTLTIDYQPIEFFHSVECGAMFNFNIQRLGATCHGIDSVVLLTPLITNSPTTALRIYFTDFQ